MKQFFLWFGLLGAGAVASPPSSYYLRPCNYWVYDSSSNSYKCQNLDFSVYVVTQEDVEQLRLEIERLKDRIQKLEQGD